MLFGARRVVGRIIRYQRAVATRASHIHFCVLQGGNMPRWLKSEKDLEKGFGRELIQP